MLRTIGILAIAALGAACARQVGTSTTTVTSGTTPGARVTGMSPGDAASMRLADEICNRQEACGQIGDGAQYRSVEACMSDQGSRSPARAAHWSCAPAESQASFETCLAAIRGERCDTPLASIDELRACRSNVVCGQ
jgi:Family of unknown function (DUF6184)